MMLVHMLTAFAHYECSEKLHTIARPARQSAKNVLLHIIVSVSCKHCTYV